MITDKKAYLDHKNLCRERRGAALAGSGVRGGCLSVWLGLPGRIRLSAPTRPFAERRIKEALGCSPDTCPAKEECVSGEQ